MYVGVTVLLAGEALYFAAPSLAVHAVGRFAGFPGFVVLSEAPRLRRQFGGAHVAYRASVPRWIPRRGAAPTSPAEQG